MRHQTIRSRTKTIVRVLLLLYSLLLTACSDRGPSIDALRAGGELRVALVSVPHTYFLEPDGILGFDYDLLRAFCAEQGIRLKVTLVETRAEATDLVARRKVHLAAGLVPVSDALDTNIRFGPSYAMLRSRVIFRAGTVRPHSVDDLIGQSIETAGGGDVDLARFTATVPGLTFAAPAGASTEQVLARVDAGITDYAVVPSLDFEVLRLKYPQLEPGFDVGPPRAVAWALSDQFQPDIDRTIVDFFLAEEQTRIRQLLWHRYYGHYGAFDFVDARAFLRAYDERLPEFRGYFEQAGGDVGIDWRLLAALSYQESHWDPAARSQTGVRGLMMLTRRTAPE
jgi:membrane-bound lytic murein transglycosylase F